MWAYYVTERSKGRTPTGAELDRITGYEQLRPEGAATVEVDWLDREDDQADIDTTRRSSRLTASQTVYQSI